MEEFSVNNVSIDFTYKNTKGVFVASYENILRLQTGEITDSTIKNAIKHMMEDCLSISNKDEK